MILYKNWGKGQVECGQMQRIVLARAFYKDNNFLILDESTNSLDKKTEYKIINNNISKK